ncbi:MAG: hypothetical protein Q7T76_14540 [Ferruginibacter sp.]|nr:hypothetical protein [Ferruginibacter sp.]
MQDCFSFREFCIAEVVRGCDNVDWVSLIIDWVEQSKVPTEVVASITDQGKIITKTNYPSPSSKLIIERAVDDSTVQHGKVESS